MPTNSLKIISLIVFLFLFVFLPSEGQEKKPSSVFIYHTVEKKETIYSIAKEHEVTPEDIYRVNPNARQGIKRGEILQIPQKTKSQGNNQDSKEILYKVNKDESLYFIAKKFNCSQEDIIKLNPGLSSLPVKRGMILKVPNPDIAAKAKVQESSKDGMVTYKIQNGDTYFNLKKRFNVEKEDLEKINQSLKNGLKEGLTIKIPVKQDAKNTNSAKENLQADHKTADLADLFVNKRNKAPLLNIGLYLPFKAELNDSSKITAHTANYLEFYEGAMLAAEDLSAEGMKLKLFVYDTHQDPKVIEQLVKKPEFLSLDLIIGPVYPECQQIMSELSAKNHIPMISPLSPNSRFVSGNPWYFQINPDRKIRLNATADYLLQEFQGKNVVMIVPEDENNGSNILSVRLKQRLHPKDFHIYDLWNNDRSGIENQLNPDKENVILLTEPDEAKVSVAITRLNTESKKYRIILIGLQEYTRMQSINTEYLHNLNLHYLTPYYLDYNNENVKNFTAKFRLNYSAEPSQYAFQGYDVMIGFLKEFHNTFKKALTGGGSLLQANYNFQRISAFGGYVNTSFFIIEYNDAYEIRTAGKINASL